MTSTTLANALLRVYCVPDPLCTPLQFTSLEQWLTQYTVVYISA